MALLPFLCYRCDLPPYYRFHRQTSGVIGLYDGQWLYYSQGAAGWDPRTSVPLNRPWPEWSRFDIASSPPGPKYASYFLVMVPWWFPLVVAAILPLRWMWVNRDQYRIHPRRRPRGFEIIPIPQPLNPPLPIAPADKSASFGPPH